MPIITDGLTNTQIMNESPKLLTSIQKQVRFLMLHHLERKACPNCGELHNLPEAAGVDVDEFNFGDHARFRDGNRIGQCRKCKRSLLFVLPLFGDGWRWHLDATEAMP